VSPPVSVFVTDLDHSTHFLLGGNIIYAVTSVENISPPFISSIYLQKSGFYLSAVGLCHISLPVVLHIVHVQCVQCCSCSVENQCSIEL
jgi:hypothetical protein